MPPLRSLTLLCVLLAAPGPLGCGSGEARVVAEGDAGLLPGGQEALTAVENLGSAAGVAPRLRATVRLRQEGGEREVRLVGLSPLREAEVSDLPGPLRQGRVLSAEPGLEIVLGPRLAEALGAPVGAPLTLEGADASGWDTFSVVGISQVEDPAGDGWVHINDLQELTGVDDGLSALVVVPRAAGGAASLAAEVGGLLPGAKITVQGEAPAIPPLKLALGLLSFAFAAAALVSARRAPGDGRGSPSP